MKRFSVSAFPRKLPPSNLRHLLGKFPANTLIGKAPGQLVELHTELTLRYFPAALDLEALSPAASR